MIGRVISVKLKDTATVLVSRTKTHPLYKKTYLQTKKYLVGIDKEVKEGDIVNFINCKPISKNKHWIITKVLGRSLAEIAEEKLKIEAAAAIAEVMPEEKEKVEKLDDQENSQLANQETGKVENKKNDKQKSSNKPEKKKAKKENK